MANVTLKPQYQQGTAAATPQVTYTPNGIPRQPGFYNASNPYDTGRPGEQNRELNNGAGGKLNGWDYDKGAPMQGTTLGSDGLYSLGGGGGGGGSGGGALESSPYYQQVLASTNSSAAADAASRRTAIQQAVIGWGDAPEGFSDKFGDVDQLTRDLASKNTSTGISTKARLLQARTDAIRKFTRSLSARGLRRSGAKGYGLRRRQLEFDQGYADALSKLLGYTGSTYSQFGQNEYQRQLALANALAYASQSLGAYGGASGTGGGGGYTTPTYDKNYSVANYLGTGGGGGTSAASYLYTGLSSGSGKTDYGTSTPTYGGSGGSSFRAM